MPGRLTNTLCDITKHHRLGQNCGTDNVSPWLETNLVIDSGTDAKHQLFSSSRSRFQNRVRGSKPRTSGSSTVSLFHKKPYKICKCVISTFLEQCAMIVAGCSEVNGGRRYPTTCTLSGGWNHAARRRADNLPLSSGCRLQQTRVVNCNSLLIREHL